MSVRNTIKSIQDIMRKDVGVDGDAQRLAQLCWMFFLKIIDDQDQQLSLMKDDYHSPIPENLQWRNWAADPEGITGDELLNFINIQLFPQLKKLSAAGNQEGRLRMVRTIFEDTYNYMKSGQLIRQVINCINRVDFNNLTERQHFGDIYEQLLNDLQNAGSAGEYYTPRAVTAFMVDRVDPKPGETLFDPACGTGGFLTCAMRHMRERYVKRVEDEQAMQQSLRAVERKPLPHMLCITNMLLHGIENPSFVRYDNTLARPYISYTAKDRVDIILTNPPFGGKEEDGIESNFPKQFQTKETADLFLALIVRLLEVNGRAAVVLPDGSLFGEGVKTRLKEYLMEECNLHTIVRLPNSVFKPYANIGTNLLFFEKGQPTKEIWFYEHQVPTDQKAYSMTRPIRIEHFRPCVDWWGGADRKGRIETEFAWRVTADEIKARGYNLDFKNPHTVAENYGNPEELLAKLDDVEKQTASLRNQLKDVIEEEALLRYFDRISDAPDAVSRLRRFIYDLAVRGKLVEQVPNDEPAIDLLKRIQVEKTQLLETGKLKKQKSLSPVKQEEEVFKVPSNWIWVRLNDITSYIQRGKSPKYSSTEGVPVISQRCVQWSGLDLRPAKLITEESFKTYEEIRLLRNGDLLWNSTGTGTIGRVVRVVDPSAQLVCDSHVTLVRCLEVDNEYVCLWLRSGYVYGSIEIRARGSTNQVELTSEMAINQLVPLPPLGEQRRIVAKVGELMVLCNELEKKIAATASIRSQLLEAVLCSI